MVFERSPQWLVLVLLVAGGAGAACGVSDRHVSLRAGGQAGSAGSAGNTGSSQAGSGGNAASAGASEHAGAGGENGGAAGDFSAGGAGAAGEAGEGGESGGGSVEPSCAVGAAPYCADSFTPALCVGGVWVKQSACGGSKPVCSNGVCANATLFGGIVTVVPTPSTGAVQIVDQGFELARPVSTSMTSCAEIHKGLTVCLTGGLTAHGVAPTLASGGSGS